MEKYQVRDLSLAPSGHRKIQWVRDNMPLLRGLEDEFIKTRPFEGIKISLSVHLEAKTAYLCLVLAAGGAGMSVTGSNVLSTQDDVAAALAEPGTDLRIFAKPEVHGHRRMAVALAVGESEADARAKAGLVADALTITVE